MTDDRSDHRDTRLFVALVLGGIVVFAAAIAIGAVLDAPPGSLAEWIAAISTFAALLAASYAAVQTSKTFRLERDRDEQRAHDAKQSQAALVAVWSGRILMRGPLTTITWSGNEPARQTTAPGVALPEYFPVNVRNASKLPVFGFTVDVYLTNQDSRPPTLAARYVWEGAVVDEYTDIDIATPDLLADLERALIEHGMQPDELSAPLSLGWTFRDIVGVTWRKVPGQRLMELDDTTR